MKKISINSLKKIKSVYLAFIILCLCAYTKFSFGAGTDLFKKSNDNIINETILKNEWLTLFLIFASTIAFFYFVLYKKIRLPFWLILPFGFILLLLIWNFVF